jgi:hypothetical protein
MLHQAYLDPHRTAQAESGKVRCKLESIADEMRGNEMEPKASRKDWPFNGGGYFLHYVQRQEEKMGQRNRLVDIAPENEIRS